MRDFGREIASFQNANMQGQAALKASLLINGGASVALLAFVGTIVKDKQNFLLLPLCFSMFLFVLGVLCAAIATGVTYVTGLINARVVDLDGTSNANEGNGSKLRLWFWVFNWVAIILVIASYFLFFIGFLKAYFAFTHT